MSCWKLLSQGVSTAHRHKRMSFLISDFCLFYDHVRKNNGHQMLEDPLIGSNANKPNKTIDTRIRTSVANFLTEERLLRGERKKQQSYVCPICLFASLHHSSWSVCLPDCSVTSAPSLCCLSVCPLSQSQHTSVKLQVPEPGLTQPASL